MITVTNRANLRFAFLGAALSVMLFSSDTAFTQAGAKWATGLNPAGGTDALGTSTNFPLTIKVNNIQRGIFTNTGIDIYGNIHSTKNTVVDSILSAWKAMVADALSVGGNLTVSGNAALSGTLTVGNNFLLNGTNSSLATSSGFINFGNTSFTNVNNIAADSINAKYIATDYTDFKKLNADSAGVNYISSGSAELNNVTSASIQTAYISADSASLNYITSQNIQSPVISSSSYLLNGTPLQPSQWVSSGSNSISYTGNATVNGTFQANAINTANITISDKFTAKRGEFDTLKVAARFSSVKMIESDTLHAIKSLEVNNSLRLTKETTANYAEVSTKDTMVTLVLQKEAAAQVRIGGAATAPPSSAPASGSTTPDKLLVAGNSRFQGDVNVTGSVSADCVTTSCLKVSGQTSFDSLRVANTIRAKRIAPLSGDSVLFMGDSTLTFSPDALDNSYITSTKAFALYAANGDLRLQTLSEKNAIISTNQSSFLGIGTNTPEKKLHVTTNHTIAQAGGGMVGSHQGIRLENVTLAGTSKWDVEPIFGNPPGIAPVSKFTIGPPLSPKFTILQNGNTGIGTTIPSEKLEVNNGNVLIKGNGNFSASNDEAKLFLGNTGYAVKSIMNYGLKLETEGVSNGITLLKDSGNVGIGTDAPREKLQIGDRFTFHDQPTAGNNVISRNATFDKTTGFYRRIKDGHASAIFFDPRGLTMQTAKNDNAGTSLNNDWKHGITVSLDGNVGIGTDQPAAKFHIKSSADRVFLVTNANGVEKFLIKSDGMFYARGYKIMLAAFPDYVYESGYKRMTAEERDAYINEYCRMPYMPSASEIEKDGLDIGDGLKGIAKNVEEISLDVSDLYKMLKEQSKEIEKLKKQLTDCNSK